MNHNHQHNQLSKHSLDNHNKSLMLNDHKFETLSNKKSHDFFDDDNNDTHRTINDDDRLEAESFNNHLVNSNNDRTTNSNNNSGNSQSTQSKNLSTSKLIKRNLSETNLDTQQKPKWKF